MPTESEETTQFSFKTENGEFKPLAIGELNLDEYTEIENNVENAFNNTECEIMFKMSRMSRKKYKRWKKTIKINTPRFFKNNWRKRHYLPLIRRKGERKCERKS